MARQTYSLDFKAAAAKLVTEQGRGLKDVATSLGVPTSTMQYWVRRFGTPAARPQVPDDPAVLRLENDRLREENKRLTMEREILKNRGRQNLLDQLGTIGLSPGEARPGSDPWPDGPPDPSPPAGSICPH